MAQVQRLRSSELQARKSTSPNASPRGCTSGAFLSEGGAPTKISKLSPGSSLRVDVQGNGVPVLSSNGVPLLSSLSSLSFPKNGSSLGSPLPGTQFACLTSTKVQILTPSSLRTKVLQE